MSISIENYKRHTFASFLRAIDPSEKPDSNCILTKDNLYNNTKNLLNAVFPPKNRDQTVRHGLKTSLDYVISVLSFEITKAGTLHNARLSTKALEKVLSCKVYQGRRTVVADNDEVIDPGALSTIAHRLSTFPSYYDSFNSLLLNPKYDSKVRIKFDLSVKRYSKEEDDTIIVYVMAEPIERWWSLYCTGDKTHIEESRSWLWCLLSGSLLLIWHRIHRKIDDQLWSYWYTILITSAACCVILDAYHRKCDSISGVKHILSKDYAFDDNTVVINISQLEDETFGKDEVLEIEDIEQAICFFHQTNETKAQPTQEISQLVDDFSSLTVAMLAAQESSWKTPLQFVNDASMKQIAYEQQDHDPSVASLPGDYKHTHAPVRNDNPTLFFEDLGFEKNKVESILIDRPDLEEFSNYDLFAVLSSIYDELRLSKPDKLVIKQPSELTSAFTAFGFTEDWANKYTKMVGAAYADQVVLRTIDICLSERLYTVWTNDPYPGVPESYLQNQWLCSSDDSSPCHIRNQMRYQFHDLGKDENEIELNILKDRHPDATKGNKLWFHATKWNNAQSIIQNGPNIPRNPSDFSPNGAFYLNDDYIDCYNFLDARRFEGQHAILIYKFEPDKLEGHGKHFQDSNEWKSHVFDCLHGRQDRSKNQWYYGLWCTRPASVQNKNQVTPRISRNNELAMQLAIIHVKMSAKVHECLIGCVFYRNLKCSNSPNRIFSASPSTNALDFSLDNIQLSEHPTGNVNSPSDCQQKQMESNFNPETTVPDIEKSEQQPYVVNKGSSENTSDHNTDETSNNDKEEIGDSNQNSEDDLSDIPKNENHNSDVKEAETISINTASHQRSKKHQKRK